MNPSGLHTITTSIKKNLRYKRALGVRPRCYDLSIEDQAQPSGRDNISHAIRLYSTMRALWRKGTTAEDGVCYVKVNGEFIEIKMKKAKF
jgi:hypothetical protein